MSTLDDLAKAIDEVVTHRIDVLTDGDWFEELLERKISEKLKERKDEIQNTPTV